MLIRSAIVFLFLPALFGHPAVAEDSKVAEFIRNYYRDAADLEIIPFPELVAASYDRKVIPFDPESESCRELMAILTGTLDATLREMSRSDSPVHKLSRINEASRFFEEAIRQAIDEHASFRCDVPQNLQGEAQTSGYPDLLVVHEPTGESTYIDPKLFLEGSETSSLRTFYFKPDRKTGKITRDARHLLIGISHDGMDGTWAFNGWQIIDLYHLDVRFKAEFQASNRDLYRKENTIAESK